MVGRSAGYDERRIALLLRADARAFVRHLMAKAGLSSNRWKG
jgi:hypothetical protein